MGDLVEREKRTIGHMIAIYCRGNRHSASGLCGECQKLVRYAYQRIEGCPYNSSLKPVCGLCRTNCFSADMHRLFREVMRQAGPRMMVRHPLLSFAHVWDAVRWKIGESRRMPNP